MKQPQQAVEQALVALLQRSAHIRNFGVDFAPDEDPKVTFVVPSAIAEAVIRPLREACAAQTAKPPSAEKAAPQYDEVTERIQKFTENWLPCVSGQGGHARLLKNMGWLAAAFPDARHVNIVCGTAKWNATCQTPWDTHELCRVFDNARDRRKPVVPPYGATVANSPRFGTRYRGWLACGSDETSGRFYRRTGHAVVGTCTVAWTGIGWVLHWGERHHDTYMGACSLDEALDRAKEMMG